MSKSLIILIVGAFLTMMGMMVLPHYIPDLCPIVILIIMLATIVATYIVKDKEEEDK